MATVIQCSMCEKGEGACLCAGCKKQFCMNCFKSHRDTLSNEMDVIIEDRDDLQDKLNKASQHNDSCHPLLAQIDEWQQKTIEKVKEAAEQARQQVKKILNSKRIEITTQFETISKELVQLKETEDFFEHDLARFHQNIQQLNQDLTLLSQPLAIELHTEQGDKIVWNRLIYVQEKSTFSDATPQRDYVENCDDEELSTGVKIIFTQSDGARTRLGDIYADKIIGNIVTDLDEFEAGQTANIQRQNPIIIATNNDRFVATVCCHRNQLLYNDYNQRNQTAHLTLIPDVTQPTNKQIIDWVQPEALVGGGDDEWIQDIAYSTKLGGYLLLNRSRLRFLHDDTHVIDEFYQFPERNMERVTCNDTFIYLILASGITGQHSDEIIMMNYDKEEKICKTFRDVVPLRKTRLTGPLIGEISDIAVNNHGQIVFSYRLERHQEVGVCVYNVSNNGNDWSFVKQLLLNECWHNDLSYTPRIEWCEKLNVFMLVEYITGHLIMLDQTGHVKGEKYFAHAENRRDSPLNLSISTNDWLCVRYESSINIHRIEDD